MPKNDEGQKPVPISFKIVKRDEENMKDNSIMSTDSRYIDKYGKLPRRFNIPAPLLRPNQETVKPKEPLPKLQLKQKTKKLP